MAGIKSGWGLVAAALMAASAQGGSILYVDDGAPAGGTGESWQTAFRYLQDAMAQAVTGIEVRVAGGTYRPDRFEGTPGGSGDRSAGFVLQSGVAISGGWAGPGAPDPDARNPTLYATVLSGDLAGDDLPGFVNVAENSYHVVIASAVDATAVLDGVTIRGGNADGPGNAALGGGIFAWNGSPTFAGCRVQSNRVAEYGGAAYFDQGKPTFTSCAFIGGEAEKGGLIYGEGSLITIRESSLSNGVAEAGGGVYIEEGTLTMTASTVLGNQTTGNFYDSGGGIYAAGVVELVQCTFTANVAESSGGALYAQSGTVTVTDCAFIANGGGPQGSLGGAMYLSAPTEITGSSFTDNTCGGAGGAIYLAQGGDALITDTVFDGNQTHSGGAVYQQADNDLVMTGCTFTGNQATDGKGGAFRDQASGGTTTIIDCWFQGNSASRHGGALSLQSESTTVVGSTLLVNFAAFYGGAVHHEDGAEATFTDCVIRGNGAYIGGGLYSLESSPEIIASEMFGNTATAWGGAMYNAFSDTVYDGTLIHGNTAALRGGGVYNFRCDPVLTGCTLTHNIAGTDGGGIYNQVESFPALENCIVWGNADGGPADFSAQITDAVDSATACAYSCVQGWVPALGGEGNTAANPLLADPEGPDGTPGTADDDLTLQPGSPVIDAGRNGAVPPDASDLDGDGDVTEALPVDLAGNPRFADDPATADTGCGAPGLVDMGAYELQGAPMAPVAGDLDGDHSVGVNDLLALLAAWGPCGGTCCLADLDGNGLVGLDDLVMLLEGWK